MITRFDPILSSSQPPTAAPTTPTAIKTIPKIPSSAICQLNTEDP